MNSEDNQREKQGVEEQNRKTGEKVVDGPKAKVERQKNNNNNNNQNKTKEKNLRGICTEKSQKKILIDFNW